MQTNTKSWALKIYVFSDFYCQCLKLNTKLNLCQKWRDKSKWWISPLVSLPACVWRVPPPPSFSVLLAASFSLPSAYAAPPPHASPWVQRLASPAGADKEDVMNLLLNPESKQLNGPTNYSHNSKFTYLLKLFESWTLSRIHYVPKIGFTAYMENIWDKLNCTGGSIIFSFVDAKAASVHTVPDGCEAEVCMSHMDPVSGTDIDLFIEGIIPCSLHLGHMTERSKLIPVKSHHLILASNCRIEQKHKSYAVIVRCNMFVQPLGPPVNKLE